ncbi:hypothetical protein EJ04DRAFT_580639 [Polyplosphaeria fusca]|uniref:DUF985 domain-containing protein n=1 Tax=Polyplosphaeria fusca TaxID=682080 RepID=A0A9P4QLA4_9PLEO|nr:hypothetical protein EJ04DRAFT_580639 [Polyplosphaeria fusca]
MSPSKSSIDPSLPPLKPHYTPNPDPNAPESPSTASLIQALNLTKHIEGGYFSEIDRNPLIIPNPFLSAPTTAPGRTAAAPRSNDDTVRNASTSIYYLLTRNSPQGAFHRNKGRTVHTLIRGRGRYVVIHADEPGGQGGKKRVETFVVGREVGKGEKVVWVVEGGKGKGTWVLPEGGDGGEGNGGEGELLVSETVIPGFEYSDHDFLTMEEFRELVTEEQAEELGWLVRKGAAPGMEELL